MHTGITTGKVYAQSIDGGEIVEVAPTAELKVDCEPNKKFVYDEMASIAFGVPSETISLDIPKQDMNKIWNALFMHRVWYRKRKGKRYNLTYRYESILASQEKTT